MFYCKYCSFRCSTWKVHMRHTFDCHSSTPSFRYPCGFSGCIQTFSTFSAISSHLRRRHPSELTQLEGDSGGGDNGQDQTLLQWNTGDLDDPNEDHEEELTTTDSHLLAQKSTALLLLTLKERHRLTQAAVNFSVGQIKQMVLHVLDDVKASVKSKLDVDGRSDIDECFYVDPFQGLDTEHLQTKFYRENFNLVEPITIKLGTELVPVQNRNKRRLQERNDTFQYVPLLEGLSSLLMNQEIADEVLQGHSRTDEYIADFCDGELFKEHALFKNKHLNLLQLVMYFDEVEVCNPLAGHAGVHKLGMFYYVLGNIRPPLRSTHRAIQLVACIECPILVKYGFEMVLEPFIKDVNTLGSEGITVDVRGISHHFYGTVLLCLADTVAAHQLGGFKVGVGFSLRICRDCMATRECIQSKFVEDDFLLRDPATHDIHCSKLDGLLSSEDSVTYGINATCPLNSICHFHVAKSQIPQDVMHVLLEGVLPMETKLMLNSSMGEGYITLELLNRRVSHFAYGRIEARNKPPKDFQKAYFTGPGSKLHLSSSQMWNFAILLPLMIGDKIPEDNPQWECFLLLLEITKVCTARTTSSKSRDYLKALIEDHHRHFKSCYPEVTFTPKMHYMIHFPRLLTYVGPLVSTWCMRMEAKNSYFKRVAQIGNFKNLPLSVAKRHQRLLCGHLQGKFFLYDELESGPCKAGSITKLSGDAICEAISELLPDTDLQTVVARPNWIHVYGERFYRSEFVHNGFQEDDLPIFGKIVDIIVIAGSIPVLQLDTYKTMGINSHLSSFQVSRTNLKTVILLSQLHNKDRYCAHSSPGDPHTYITMRSHVPNLFS